MKKMDTNQIRANSLNSIYHAESGYSDDEL